MSESRPQTATRVLSEWANGDDSAAHRLLPVVYDELRDVAGALMHRERREHTLQPTALVNEAFVKLIDSNSAAWQNRAHFMAVASTAMRHILTDHARRKGSQKRGGGHAHVTLNPEIMPERGPEVDLVALDEALETLSGLNQRHGRIVELRFFGGLTIAETAQVLGVSTTTVEDDWRLVRAWLACALDENDAG